MALHASLPQSLIGSSIKGKVMHCHLWGEVCGREWSSRSYLSIRNQFSNLQGPSILFPERSKALNWELCFVPIARLHLLGRCTNLWFYPGKLPPSPMSLRLCWPPPHPVLCCFLRWLCGLSSCFIREIICNPLLQLSQQQQTHKKHQGVFLLLVLMFLSTIHWSIILVSTIRVLSVWKDAKAS